MKLLLDANISWRLTSKLNIHFNDCLHVDKTSLAVPAKDIEIWEFAKANDLILVTNDEDFLDLISVKGFPPKIVLLRTGNQSSNFIEALLLKHRSSIAELETSEDYGLLELY